MEFRGYIEIIGRNVEARQLAKRTVTVIEKF